MLDYSHLKPLKIQYHFNATMTGTPNDSRAWICDKDGNRLMPAPLGCDGDLICWMIKEINRDSAPVSTMGEDSLVAKSALGDSA